MKMATKPKSFCRCGHTGDGPDSQHEDRYAPGHGFCRECACRQFTWVRWTEYGKKWIKKQAAKL